MRRAARAWAPDAVAVAVGPEDLAWVQAGAPQDAPTEGSAPSDTWYLEGLRSFGAVRFPPPDLEAAVAVATERGVPLVALDMPEDAYLERFLDEVSTLDLCHRAVRVRRQARRGLRAATPWAFVEAWQAGIRSIAGYDRLAAHREAHIAERLAELPHARVLAVAEAHLVAGVAATVGGAHATPRPALQMTRLG